MGVRFEDFVYQRQLRQPYTREVRARQVARTADERQGDAADYAEHLVAGLRREVAERLDGIEARLLTAPPAKPRRKKKENE